MCHGGGSLNHPDDNFFDPGRLGDISIMFQRPRDIKRLIEAIPVTIDSDVMFGSGPSSA